MLKFFENKNTKKIQNEYKKYSFLFLFLASLLFVGFFVVPNAFAATGINKQISFQGKVVNTDGTNVTSGSYTFLFCIYTTASPATACTAGADNDAVWRESKSITVTDGIFQTNLGDTTAFASLIDFNTDNIYLGINFNANGQMSPLVRFTATPYALNAAKVGGLTVTDTTGTLTIPNSETISFGGSFSTTASNDIALTTSGATTLTLPTTGTLATLAGTEVLTNKTIGSTGLTFSGAATDITTASGESLVVVAAGAGTIDLQDATTVDSLTTDTGGVTIASGQSYSGSGAVTLSSASATALTLNSGTNGTINIGTDASAETINIGNTGAAAKTIAIGNNTQANTITIGDASVTGLSLTDNNWSISTAGAAAFASLSSSGAIAANGGITFDASTDTVGAFTSAGTIDMNTNILTNIGNTGTDFVASTGALTLAGILTANGGISLPGSQSLAAAALSYVDLGLITHSSTANQGLRLPNAPSATPSNPTSGEGYLAWDATGNQLIAYNGSAWTTVGGAGVSADSLDFTEFQDQLDLDASTDILAPSGQAYVLSITNEGTGNSFRVNDANADTTPFVIDASGNVGIGDSTPDALLDFDLTSTSGTASSEYGSFFTITDTGAVNSGVDITRGNQITVTRSGATGGTLNTYGQSISVNNTFASGSGSANTYGADISVIGNTIGTSETRGIFAAVAGADTNYGGYFGSNDNVATGIYTEVYPSSGGTGTGVDIYLEEFSTTANTNYGVKAAVSSTGNVSSGSDISYGANFSVTQTGASGGNIDAYGVYTSVTGSSGGTSAAYGIYGRADSADSNVGGFFSANGTSAMGISSQAYTGAGNGTGLDLYVEQLSTTTANINTGINLLVSDGWDIASGTDTTYGINASVGRTGATTGTIDTYGINLSVSGDTGGASTATGLAVAVSGADTNYSGLFTGGNFGIGDTTPTSLFSVGATSQFQVNSTGAIAAATGITSSGTITFSGLSTAGIVTNTAGGVLGTTISVPVANGGTNATTIGSAGSIAYSTGTAYAFSAVGTAGQALVSGGTGVPTFFAPTAGSILFAGTSGILEQDNANFFFDNASNELGLGTASPSAQLDIFGTTNALRLSYDVSNYASLSSLSDGTLSLTSSNVSESQFVIGTGSATDDSVAFDGSAQDYYAGLDHTSGYFTIGTGFTVGTSTLFALDSTGNVGIGTGVTAPAARLDLALASTNTTGDTEYGQRSIISDTGIVTTGTDTTYGNSIGVTRTGATGGTIDIYGQYISVTTDNAGAGTSTAYGMYSTVSGADTNYAGIFMGGNVGVGDVTPDNPFEIVSTSQQLRLSYTDGSVDGVVFVDSNEYLTLQAGTTGEINRVQVGAGGAGNTTPDLLGLDVKSDTGDPAGGFEGAIYYNTFDNVFRCYQGAGWTNCIGSGGASDLQTAYGTDADGSNVTISLTADDDGLVFTNPSSGGNDLSSFVLQVSQQNTTAAIAVLDLVQSSNAANGVNVTANSIDSETGLAITTNGLTSGKGLSVTSSATAFTGDLAGISFTGSNVNNTGNVFAVSNTGALNTNVSLFVDHRATGTNNLAVRVNDVSGDTTPFVIDGTGSVGIGTVAPARILDIVQAASAPQLRLSKDLTNYSEMTVDSAGDLLIGATGTDIRALSENVWICDNDACPALTLTGDGNIFVENVIKFGNGVYMKNDSATELGVYDNDDQAMLIFDEL